MEQNHIILVVNENAEKRAVFRKRLEQKAMVLESGNEDAAIKLLGAVKISLVFLIPGQGEEESFLLRRMKEQGLVERIPVMVCDNSYDQERMNRFYAWGCSDYVCEPLSDLVLYRKLAFMLRLLDAEKMRTLLSRKEKKGPKEGKLSEKSYDAMTGLLNHSYAIQAIKKAIQDHPEKSVAIAVMDVNHLKKANDQYGYLFGNRVLRYVSERLTEAVRESDIVSRFGDDEFLIYIQHNGHPEIIFDRIQQLINGYVDNYALSVSIGIACDQVAGRDFDMLFSAADKALHYVENTDRSGYCFYQNDLKTATIH